MRGEVKKVNGKLKEKINESLSSVLPITLIVLLLSITFVPMDIGTLALFVVGAVLLIVGMGFFQLGAEMSISPLGRSLGTSIMKTGKLWLILIICLFMGVIITVAEPDLMVLANQIATLSNGTIIYTHYFLLGVNEDIPLYDGSKNKDLKKDPIDGNYRTSYEFNGWSLEKDGVKAYDVGHPLVPTQSIVLYPYYSKKYGLKLELTFSGSVSMNITSDTEHSGTHNANKTLHFQVSSLDDTVTVTYSVTNNESNLTVKHNGNNASASNGIYTITIDSTKIHTVSIAGSCISAGTLLTLWDGSKKPVEQITDDDLLLVFNHETGTYDFANIIFNESDGWKIYKLINLVFSNGQTSKIIYEHGFYDLDLNKYIYIDANNYQNYIGHRFYTAEFINGIYLEEEVILEDAYISEEYTGCYSPVTVYHMNYFTDGILSMPGGIGGLFNIFEMNDDLKYDFEQMEEDIEKYGLYTYEDFKDYIPYEVYAAFPAEYFKVSVGKGYITWDGILALIDRYLSLMV